MQLAKSPTTKRGGHTGILNMSIPVRNEWRRKATLEVDIDHSSHGIRNCGTPYKNMAKMPVHLMKSHMD